MHWLMPSFMSIINKKRTEVFGMAASLYIPLRDIRYSAVIILDYSNETKIIHFPYGCFIRNKQLNLTPLMIDTLLAACETTRKDPI